MNMGFHEDLLISMVRLLIRVTFNSLIMMSMARPLRAHSNSFIILYTSKILTFLPFISFVEDISKVDKDYPG